MEVEILLLIIFLISAVVVLGVLEFAMGMGETYKVCGWADTLMPFRDQNRVIHDYFCYSI